MEHIEDLTKAHGYSFPYLFDRDNRVVRAYRVACTPSCYVFDVDLNLVYRGQFDNSRPDNAIPTTGKDVTDALGAVLEGRPVPQDQKTAVGCYIPFDPENKPDYMR